MTPVSNAVDSIRDNLKDGWFDGVTPGELRENNQILDGLTPEQTNDAISELNDGDLNKWADEIYDGKFLGVIGDGGLAVGDRQDLYQNLARDLEPDQLQRVYSALGNADRQAEFISAISTHAPDANKTALVERLADQTTDDPIDTDAGFGSVSNRYSDQDATAVATLIASLDNPASIDRAISALNDEQLEAVLHAGIDQRSITATFGSGHGSSTSFFFDTSGFTALIDTVSKSKSPQVQARVFELGARQIDDIRDTDSLLRPNLGAGDAAGEVADSLTGLLKANTGNIVTSLERGDGILSSRTGNGLSVFSAELVRQGDTDTLQELIAQLQGGDDLSQDPTEFLPRSTTDNFGNRDFQNASNLGFLIGSVREGLGKIQTDRQEQADTLTAIFGTALGLGGLVPGLSIPTKAALTIARPLSAEVVSSITGSLSSGDLELGDALEQLALPPNVFSSDVTGPFGDAIDTVVRN